MVQGGKAKKHSNINDKDKKNSRKKEKQEAPKKKAPMTDKADRIEGNEVLETFQRKVNSHYKKVYRSIEETIIGNAKKNRERFDIL